MNPACPPPPILFVSNPELLARIQAQITAPPDPRILPWDPPPQYDPQSVAIRIRLDRAARERKPEPVADPKPPTRVESAFATSASPAIGPGPLRGLFQLSDQAEVQTDRLTAPDFRASLRPHTQAEPTTDSAPAFGIAQGAHRRKKDDVQDKDKEKPRRRHDTEDDLQERLKRRFL